MKKGLSQETLKIIACLTMLVDHTAVVFGLSMWLRVIGRLAFPIYCFLLTEGMHHTRNAKRYLLRLFTMAILSEPVYDLVLYPGRGIWLHQNVLWTLFLGGAMLWCMGKTEKYVWKILLIVPFALLAQLMRASYGSSGIYMIALFALCRGLPEEKPVLALGLLGINGLMNSAAVTLFGLAIPVQLFAVLALIPIFLYSGEKRSKSRALCWVFYFFYPLHLLALSALSRYVF